MRRTPDLDEVMRRLWVLALCAAAWAPTAGAQNSAKIVGRVVDKTSKVAIVGAEVLLAPGTHRLLSDEDGGFRFEQVSPGDVMLIVRRLGFVPESAYFPVQSNEDLDVVVELKQAAQSLDTVSVSAPETPVVRGKLVGFYERKRFGIGKFIDADMIAKEPHSRLGDVITSFTPGSRLVRARIGLSAWVATTRDTGARPSGGSTLDPLDVRRGADPLACYPDVYVDGTAVYRFGVRTPLFDINSIGPAEVAAIEFYVGSARVPVQYMSSTAACGVLLIWTK